MAAVFLSFAPSQLDLDPRYIVSEEKGAQSTTPQLHLSTSRREAALLIKPTESRWSERVSGLTLSATLDNSEQCAPLEPMKALTVQCGGKVDDDRPPCHCRKDWDACQGSPMAKKSDDNAVVLNAELPQENNKFRLTVSWCSVKPLWSGVEPVKRSFKTELKDIKVTYKLSAEEDPSADGSDSNQNAGEMEALVAPERVTVTFARAPPPELVILSPIGDDSVEPVKTCSGGRISVDAAVTALKFSVKARADPCPEITDGNRALWGGLKMGCSLLRDAHSEKTARLKCVDEVRRRRRQPPAPPPPPPPPPSPSHPLPPPPQVGADAKKPLFDCAAAKCEGADGKKAKCEDGGGRDFTLVLSDGKKEEVEPATTTALGRLKKAMPAAPPEWKLTCWSEWDDDATTRTRTSYTVARGAPEEGRHNCGLGGNGEEESWLTKQAKLVDRRMAKDQEGRTDRQAFAMLGSPLANLPELATDKAVFSGFGLTKAERKGESELGNLASRDGMWKRWVRNNLKAREANARNAEKAAKFPPPRRRRQGLYPALGPWWPQAGWG